MTQLEPIYIEGITDTRPIIIAGPCSAETEEQVIDTARKLADAGVKIFRAGIWKPRTKPGGFEGIGAQGFPWLKRVKKETGMLTATEVANRSHVIEALDADTDILWIGTRTSANPFAIQEIADALEAYGRDVPILVKNPVSPDLELWIGAIERLYNAGMHNIGAIHRGFGAYGKHIYRNMPQWHIPIELRRRFPRMTMICDPSHIGGKREYIAPLSQQALDMGFDGLIIESHCNPECAWSDKDQQVSPAALKEIIDSLVLRDSCVSTESLALLRQQIDELDNELLEILNKRMAVSRQIGIYKKEHRMPVLQIGRHDEIMNRRLAAATEMGMSADFMRTILSAIHEESVRQQIES